ncbi:cell division protein FtsQ/DivIB [Pelolinea submarina]|uniref:POTRA domain-containing FtsQ-type protein n=1 Tax=Pelolinea submarina TaxID=913107 RepID=A0A347ZS21_9CHLR|nr:FtsQ-type POTRA domain-containing protein [Pelolinea submarina]REG11333.1 POTRA domain-containing FtsQ-type protein [Pelolinea submarina]BBB48102.1 cell division protein FtsQ [Pelolinea submarina]
MKERSSRRHSEQVRRKLNQESQSSVRQAARRAIDPPVLQTSGRKGLKGTEETVSAVKRRFKPGWRLLSFAMVAALAYFVLTAFRSPEYRVSTVEISGLQRLSPEEVLGSLNIVGDHIFAIQPKEIVDSIAASYPELRDIQVTVSLPAKVTITAVERQPMFTWQMKDRLMWVDTEGYLIPARGEAAEMLTIDADALPLYQVDEDLRELGSTKIIQDKSIKKPGQSDLMFFAQTKHIDSNLLVAVLQLNAWMPNESTLLYQKQRGLGWADARGWDVFVGQKLESINDKMVMYETIVRNLEEQGINPSMVSVEFLNAPYYRVD